MAVNFGLYAQIDPGGTTLTRVGVLATDPTALAGTSSGSFTLVRSGPTTADLTVNLDISGTAVNGVDYTSIPNVATIPAGFLAVDIPVQAIVSSGPSSNKTVVITIVTNTGYLTGDGRRATVTIVYDTFNLPPPSITLTSPTNGSTFTLPTLITLSADASELNGGAIQSVGFFANDLFLGRVTNSPYSLVWSNAHQGTYALFARAVDSYGRSTLSAPVHVTVSELRPTVQLVSPTNGATFAPQTNITLLADASEEGGTVQAVSFYANGHSLGSVSNAPYSLVWSNVPAGFYFLLAVASDQASHHAYSSPALISVGTRPRETQPFANPALR
jgi:hypothetical protein